jgi:hypothetical protein
MSTALTQLHRTWQVCSRWQAAEVRYHVTAITGLCRALQQLLQQLSRHLLQQRVLLAAAAAGAP